MCLASLPCSPAADLRRFGSTGLPSGLLPCSDPSPLVSRSSRSVAGRDSLLAALSAGVGGSSRLFIARGVGWGRGGGERRGSGPLSLTALL